MDPAAARFRLLVAGPQAEVGDRRPLWATLALLEIIEGPLEVVVHKLPGIARLAARIARKQGDALTILEDTRAGTRWPTPPPDPTLLYLFPRGDLFAVELQGAARMTAYGYFEFRGRSDQTRLVESRVWCRLPTIFDLIRDLEPRAPFTIAELVEAVTTKHPRWIVPLVAEVMHRRHNEKRAAADAQRGPATLPPK